MAESIRITYVGGASTTADDARTQYDAASCSGTSLGTHGYHTLGPGSAGTVEYESRQATAVSLQWTVTGRTAPGTIHMRFEYSGSGTFTDTVLLYDNFVTYGAHTTSTVCVAWGTPTSPAICQYGTRIKPGMPAVAIIDQAIIDTALTLIPGEWLALLLNIYLGTKQDVTALCAAPPTDPIAITTNLLINPGAAALGVLQRVLWPYFCECTPGATTPVSPPPYAPVQPPGWPATPTYPCDPTTPCADFTDIRRKLDLILGIVGPDLAIDTITQRWRTPFALPASFTHTELHDTGSFSVDRVLGLLITVTTLPPGSETWPGNPVYLKDLGWIAVDDGGAMLQELRVTRQQQVWLPQHMQLATTVSYALTPGTAIAVQELTTEP